MNGHLPEDAEDTIVIEDADGRRVIDVTPVRDHVRAINASFIGPIPMMGSIDQATHHNRLKAMDAEQLRFLVVELESRLRETTRRTRWLYSTAGQTHVKETRDFVRKMDEIEMGTWPGHNELRE